MEGAVHKQLGHKGRKERGGGGLLLSLHTDIQTLSLSDPSHLSHQQSSDLTCTFCAEMRLKSLVHYPCIGYVI